MREKVTVRPAEKEDAQMYFDWLKEASDRNLVDTGVYDYPACMTFVVQKGIEPLLMNSVHPVLMMEALAPKPGISPKDEARALDALHKAVRAIATVTPGGPREIWFTCNDESLNGFVENRGFRKVNVPMFKMILKQVGTDPITGFPILEPALPEEQPSEAK